MAAIAQTHPLGLSRQRTEEQIRFVSGCDFSRISSNARGAPVAGFYTYGEIARTQGMSGFHNQTLVVLSIS